MRKTRYDCAQIDGKKQTNETRDFRNTIVLSVYPNKRVPRTI